MEEDIRNAKILRIYNRTANFSRCIAWNVSINLHNARQAE